MAVQYYFRSGITVKVRTMSEITTDRFGLSTGSVVLQYPVNTYTPGKPSGQHPYAGYLNAEKETMRRAGGWDIVTISYVGVRGQQTDPIYSLQGALNQEPIQTHPLFLSAAGTPSAPRNGAIFDPSGAFIGFTGILLSGQGGSAEYAENFKGISSWLQFGCSIKKHFYTSKKPNIKDIGRAGTLWNDCPFNVDNGGKVEWLIEDPTINCRGKVFEVIEGRKMSGPKGLSLFYTTPIP